MSQQAEQFNIHDAKTHLSRILERVERGEEIAVSYTHLRAHET